MKKELGDAGGRVDDEKNDEQGNPAGLKLRLPDVRRQQSHRATKHDQADRDRDKEKDRGKFGLFFASVAVTVV
ncbi:hypothetical protein MASR2M8_21030 [Opitutaceae bacterium]